MATGTDIPFWFLVFSSKSSRILLGLLHVAWPTQSWLLVPMLFVQICSMLSHQGEDEMKTWSTKRTWYLFYSVTWTSLGKNKTVFHLTNHVTWTKNMHIFKKQIRFFPLWRPGTWKISILINPMRYIWSPVWSAF